MPDSVHEFIVAACVPIGSSHSSGTLEQAEAILAAKPEIGTSNMFAAAVLGDDSTVRRFITTSSANATTKGGPHGWDPLTYVCFSKYLRLVPQRSEGFVRAAEALLNAGASPNSGFFSQEHQPNPEFESVLYGAAGVAHHAGLTRVLLERGADPNDGEVTYHAPETYDNAALKCLVGTGKLSADSLATMLLRKADWHDYEGIKYLLEQGADPNRITHWGFAAIHQALRRDNDLRNIEVMLDHKADLMLVNRSDGRLAIVIAARRGRCDVLDLMERRGVPVRLQGIEQLIAACARNDEVAVKAIAAREPKLVEDIKATGAALLAEFAGNGNTQGVRLLLDLGLNVGSPYDGDGYFDIAKNSTALHVAAWRARHDTVKLLIARGALVNALECKGRTPLALAVRACVDSYWQSRRSPDSVQALLQAVASVSGVQFPSGYLAVDELLRSHGAKS
jgi:ankyrin repeat protein